jgi:hypothetical protein
MVLPNKAKTGKYPLKIKIKAKKKKRKEMK